MTNVAAIKAANDRWHARRSVGPIDLSLFTESPHAQDDTLIRHRDDHALDVLPAKDWRVAVVTFGPGNRALAPHGPLDGVVERTVPFPLDERRALVFCRDSMPVEGWAALKFGAADDVVQEVSPVRESVAECMADILLGKEGLTSVYAGRFADADDEVYLVNHPAMRGMDLTDVVPHAGRLLKSKRAKVFMTWSLAHAEPDTDADDCDGEEDSQQHEDDWEL